MIVERIEAADLPAATYRTARRLLDLADDRGAVKLPHDRMREVVGTDADATVRRHLVELQGAGIIAYRRNSDVQVWFADWQPGNVISGDQHGSVVISGDQYTRGNERRSVISGDQHTRKSRAQRSKRAHTDHLPHTHASAPVLDGGMEDLDPKQNEDPSIPAPDQDEVQQAYKLMRAIGMIPEKAKPLSKLPFQRVRDCVAGWWMNRKCVGGALQDDCGIVVHWLETGKEPRLYDVREWQRSELYLAHRTPAELAADEAQPPTLPAPVIVATSQPARASPYLDGHPVWLALAADPSASAELAGLVEVSAVDSVPLYVVAAKDPSRAHWLNQRMATRLRKLVGHPCQVEVIGDEDGKQT